MDGSSGEASDSHAGAGAHSLMIMFPLADGRFGARRERKRFLRMESRVQETLSELGLGTVDGHGFGDGTAELFIYGPDADAMLDVVEPIIRSFKPPSGSNALLLYGTSDDSATRSVTLA